MIGKIVTGKSFKGAVEYVLKKKNARLLDSDGVDTESPKTIIADLNFQRKTRPEVTKAVGHISLSFHKNDAKRLSNDELMTAFAQIYMHRMGITCTQYIIVRHTDTEHPHLHIVYNRVKYDRKLVPDKHERRRNVRICKEMKKEYGLTFSESEENVKTERLHGPDKIKQEIYITVQDALPDCSDVQELAELLEEQDVQVQFIHRGNDPQKEIQGMTFTKDGHTFKASQIDRKFSYGALTKYFEEESQKWLMELTQSPTVSDWDWSRFIGEEQAGPTKPPAKQPEQKQEQIPDPTPPAPKQHPESALPAPKELPKTEQYQESRTVPLPEKEIPQPKEQQPSVQQPPQRLVELARQIARNKALKPKIPKKDQGIEM